VLVCDFLDTAFVHCASGDCVVGMITIAHDKFLFLIGVVALIATDAAIDVVAVDFVVGDVEIGISLLYRLFVSMSLYVSFIFVEVFVLDDVARALAIGRAAFVTA
jgi:hypothetical protein